MELVGFIMIKKIKKLKKKNYKNILIWDGLKVEL